MQNFAQRGSCLIGKDGILQRLDPTTGRWIQVDTKAEHDISTSPYVAHYNSPINFTDPLGDSPLCAIGEAVVNFIASIGILLPEVAITTTAVVSATAVSKAAITTSAIVATLPTVQPEYVWPLYDQFIEAGYTTAPYQRYTFFESEPGNSGRTMHVEHTLRSNDQGDLSIKNTFYRWYDSFELLEKLGGPTGVVEMVPNLMPVKAAGSTISKSLTIVAGKIAAKRGGNTSGWVKRSEFNSLDPSIQKKVADAIKNGIVAPTGKQGIIRLTATEAAQTGYQYKIKILGKGGDIRIYGNAMENGHIVFDKIMGH